MTYHIQYALVWIPHQQTSRKRWVRANREVLKKEQEDGQVIKGKEGG